MTPRELPKYEVLFSFGSLLSFYLVGRVRAHPIRKSSRSVAERIEISFHNEIYFHD